MKLNCVGCEPELAPWAAGQLDPATREAVAAHLADCPYCRAELERELALRAGLASLPLATCPDAVSQRILATVAGEQAGRRRHRRHLFYGAAATLAAAALAVALLLRPGGAPTGRHPADATVAQAPPAASAVPGPAASTAPTSSAPVEIPAPYTREQVAAARRDLIKSVTLAARLLDQAGRSTLADVFSERLPAAVAGSLRPLDDPTRGG
jgi:anti-sigma factor RsiW